MNTHNDQVVARLYDLLTIVEGEWFKVKFIKRTTGEEREMTCRRGVKKHTKGVGLAYDPIKKNLVPVWVANEGKDGADAYRMINVETIKEIGPSPYRAM